MFLSNEYKQQAYSSALDAYTLSPRQRILARLRPTTEQRRHLLICAGMLLVIAVMYQFTFTRLFLYPFELISTVFHEFGHAVMTWLTGGRVTAISINPDHSGATHFIGGIPCLILPAGYIGSSIAGATLLVLSFGRKSSEVASIVIGLILLATLWWSSTIFTAFSALLMVGMMAAVYFYRDGMALKYFILFMGTIGSVVSVLSIMSHLISNKIDGSDAVEFAKQCSILIPSMVFGFLWLVKQLPTRVVCLCKCILCRSWSRNSRRLVSLDQEGCHYSQAS